MQLEGILAKELKRKEKLMEEKLRLDRQQQKQREKELRQQQRREVSQHGKTEWWIKFMSMNEWNIEKSS